MIALIGSFQLVLFMMRLTIIGFGNQAKAAQAAQTQTAPMVLSLNGAIKATASIRLAFVAKVK